MSLQCEWTDCPLHFDDAEALYSHLTNDHVGRKSARNLNLTCAWNLCGASFSKRDHLTSHLRIHIPLKPHLCPVCSRAFKRPQDLKKHEKLHSELDQSAAADTAQANTRAAARRRFAKDSESATDVLVSLPASALPSSCEAPMTIPVAAGPPSSTNTSFDHPSQKKLASSIGGILSVAKRKRTWDDDDAEIVRYMEEISRLWTNVATSPPPSEHNPGTMPLSPAMTESSQLDQISNQDLLSLHAFLQTFPHATTTTTTAVAAASPHVPFLAPLPVSFQQDPQPPPPPPPLNAISYGTSYLAAPGQFAQYHIQQPALPAPALYHYPPHYHSQYAYPYGSYPPPLPRIVRDSMLQTAAPPAHQPPPPQPVRRAAVTIRDLVNDDDMDVAQDLLSLGTSDRVFQGTSVLDDCDMDVCMGEEGGGSVGTAGGVRRVSVDSEASSGRSGSLGVGWGGGGGGASGGGGLARHGMLVGSLRSMLVAECARRNIAVM
ncbi:hypothetical protein CcCBS67573_g10143 [Chytriomyces confervae]|uniref:C2H2-type domain-containing protein n=1 Tax=Chytriomyces confervae TaxID=246404 RepID=A0A507DE93_9FUNG|nr:hypothetical protein CcCBS67573_g10143 [Chytriomyces confervae]